MESKMELKDREVIGLYEKIILKGKERTLKVWAKIDTGADNSSIDVRLLRKLGPSPIVGSKIVKNAHGSSMRIITVIPTIIRGVEMRVRYTVADRSRMNYHVILGKNVLKKQGYLVDPLTHEPMPEERKKIWVIHNV